MARISPLFDAWGVIYDAVKRLPDEKLKLGFLVAHAELEDHECHRTRKFPKTRLHRVVGYKEPVYRADIDKISGWRLHVQYEDGQIHLKDIIEGQKHDDVLREIEAKRFATKKRRVGKNNMPMLMASVLGTISPELPPATSGFELQGLVSRRLRLGLC